MLLPRKCMNTLPVNINIKQNKVNTLQNNHRKLNDLVPTLSIFASE